MLKWTKREEEFLINNYSKYSNYEMGILLNKSELAINSKSLRLGLKKSNSYISGINKERTLKRWDDMTWSKDDIDFLVLNINNFNTIELSKKLNRSPNSIRSMCNKLQLTKIKKYNKDFIEKECLRYITKQELRISDPNLYHWLYKNGKIKDVTGHMLNISYSTPQLILQSVIKSIIQIKFNYNDRKAIFPYELDIYFPEKKFAIEYDGSYYHENGSKFKEKICSERGIKLITIDENALTKRNFDGYLSNIKEHLLANIKIINKYLQLDLNEDDILRIYPNKNEIFKGIFNIEYMRKICNKYTNYETFIKEQRKIYNKLYYLGILKDFTKHMSIDAVGEGFRFILEKSEYYRVGDIVLIEYWYNNMVTSVLIKDIIGRKFIVSHNTPNSKIKNAPDEIISKSDIIQKQN